MGFSYQPSNAEKRAFLEQQAQSMQLTYYRNILDVAKAKALRKETDPKFQGVYDQKLNEYKMQNGEIETSIDLMSKEYDQLGED